MQEWIIDFMNQFGYFGIALLIAIENIFPPIPSELILTFGGFMITYTGMNIWLVTVFATIGSVVGAIVLYGVGRLLPTGKLERVIGKYGHIMGLKKEDVRRAENWFVRRGTSTIFFCRFIPIVRSLISIPAGMAHMRRVRFLLYTTLGTAVWNVVLVCLGAFAGAEWERILQYTDIYSKRAPASPAMKSARKGWAGTMKILIDTNVIIDYLADRTPFADHAEQVLSLCESGEVDGLITANAVTDIYYVVCKVAGRDKTLEAIRTLWLIRVAIQHLFEKPSKINGLQVVGRQYLPLITQ